ncbi:MAG: DUF2652 domain-containing protein [Chitinophagaceae bacterium]
MENKGLLFIPDISGFTRFVNETDIEHSRLIIQELLELLINSNELGLTVSEVEGDAILFYKFGEAPAAEEIYQQVEKMFCEFHQALIVYDQRKFCQCKACISASGLTLKVVTHYGEFADYNVKNFNKLIGKDVIVAHQLLKNDIDQHEYWLVTKDLLPDDPAGFRTWMKWNSSTKQTENGEINFHYTQLGPLRNGIKPEPLPQPDLSKKVKVISLTREYETDMITLFHASGDFNYRSQWQEGVKKVEEVSHFLPRVGTRSRLIMDNEETVIQATSYSYSPEKLSFSETDEATNSTKYFYLEQAADNKMKLTLDIYIVKKGSSHILFNLFRKRKMEASFRRSLQNLEKVVREIRLPVNVE